jgi:AraC-like DNA-binding protein
MLPTALWFDGTDAAPQMELRRCCSSYFRIVTVRLSTEAGESAMCEHSPALVVFEFDRPDESRLQLMQSLKRRHPSVPILMVTLESSEALAVWAFRSRVWNYLVKPVDLEEFEENVLTLRATVQERSVRTHTVLGAKPQVPPLPGRAREDDTHGLGPALAVLRDGSRSKRSAAELAALCGLSRFEFSRRFRRAFGTSYQEYVQRARVSEACRLLDRGSTSVTEVGFAVGFGDSSHFAQVFKRYVGMLPSQYLARGRRPPERPPSLQELREIS